jgi:hypothetical protein
MSDQAPNPGSDPNRWAVPMAVGAVVLFIAGLGVSYASIPVGAVLMISGVVMLFMVGKTSGGGTDDQ